MTLTVLIEQHLPYDGPHRPDAVEEAASGLAAVVRYLNNATGPWNAPTTLQHAPTVDVVLGGVAHAISGLDQLLAQLADALDRQADDPTLYDDRRDRPAAQTASDAASHLRYARRAVTDLGEELGDAWDLTTHLGHDTQDECER